MIYMINGATQIFNIVLGFNPKQSIQIVGKIIHNLSIVFVIFKFKFNLYIFIINRSMIYNYGLLVLKNERISKYNVA